MHALTISRSSPYLRFFIWVWEANPEKLDICKLFWGTILFPVAFIQFKRAYRFIPRIALFYMAGAVICAALGLWHAAIIWSFFGVAFTAGGYAFMRRSQSVAERQEEKAQALSEISERRSVAVEWVLDHTLGWVLDLTCRVADSRAGYRVVGFLVVMVEYARTAKQRFCRLIKVN